ncbi:unnamed protein product [Paramecium primaurelia]|uniref:Uncharacterized protein n=1 Tax=Paramecium primaurelia TaxID=5886 RepID=A0A8S1MVB3_PARPR|nr:unnamed protein product [Paramecium primaurelia]
MIVVRIIIPNKEPNNQIRTNLKISEDLCIFIISSSTHKFRWQIYLMWLKLTQFFSGNECRSEGKFIKILKLKLHHQFGANFVGSNLSGSQFENLDIRGINLNGAQLFNCTLNKMKIHELHQIDAHRSNVNSVSFSSDDITLSSGSADLFIRLQDIKRGQQKAKLDDHSSEVNSVCFSPDGKKLSSSKVNKQPNSIFIILIQIQYTSLLIVLHQHLLANRCQNNTIQNYNRQIQPCLSINLLFYRWQNIGIWLLLSFFNILFINGMLKKRQQQAKLDGHTKEIISVCISPDGNTLASCSFDNSIRQWDVKSGQQQAKLDGHTRNFRSVNFSPDRNTLNSGSKDQSIRLWKVKTGQEINSSDPYYKDLLKQFKIPLQQNSPISEDNINFFIFLVSNQITKLIISSQALFQAQGALILKGEFINQSGSFFLEDFKQK